MSNIPIRARMAVAVGAAALLAGCGTAQLNAGIVNSAPTPGYGQESYSAIDDAEYVLHPADMVSLKVFREPELSLDGVPVGADGMLSIPLLGSIKAEGVTPRQLEKLITSKLVSGGTLVNPAVSVNVMQFASHVVTVEGSVEKPGMYSFQPGTRLSGAISLASGPNRTAKLREVAIFRQTPVGMSVAKFDYVSVRAGTMMDPIIQPRDRVVVGTSGLSQFWQDLLRTLPAFALFTNI